MTEKYNEAVRTQPYACPDEWFNQLQYYSELIVRAKGANKTPAEIVAHVIATAPKIYDTVTTLLLDKDLTEPDILKTARELYRNYWRRHVERGGIPKYKVRNGAYHVETTGNGNNNSSTRQEEVQAYGTGTVTRGKTRVRPAGSNGSANSGSTRPKAKPWKKFKGFCKTCGQQGHKYNNCPTTKVASTTYTEKRTCYNCGQPGHLSRDCTKPRKQQSMFVGSVQLVTNMDSLTESDIDKAMVNDMGSDDEYYSEDEEEQEETSDEDEQVMMVTTETTSGAEVIVLELNQDLEVRKKDDVYVHWGSVKVTHRGVQWHCYHCHKPMVFNPEWEKYECYFCEALTGYEKGSLPLKYGRGIGQCGVCQNIGPSDTDCPYCLYGGGDKWMVNYGTDQVRFINHYTKYLEEYFTKTGINEDTFYELVMWSNFKGYVMEQGKEEQRWFRRLAVAPALGKPRIYWTCSDERCDSNDLQYSMCCLTCGKGVLTEILRSYEAKTAKRYRTLLDESKGCLNLKLFKEATQEHVKEIEHRDQLEEYFRYDTPDHTVATINGVDYSQDEFDERLWATMTPKQRDNGPGRGNEDTNENYPYFPDMFLKEEGKRYPFFDEIEYVSPIDSKVPHWEEEEYPAIEQCVGGPYDLQKTIAQRLMKDPDPTIAKEEEPKEASIDDGYECSDIPNYKRTGYLKETSHFDTMLRDYMAAKICARYSSEMSDDYSQPPKEEEQVNMVVADVSQTEQGQSGGESWLFDTGATVHVTPNDSLLFNLQVCNVNISVAQGTIVVAQKRGDIKIKGQGGTTLILTDVLHVPSFTTNIISGSRLVNKSGCVVKIQKNKAEIRNEAGGFIRMEYNPTGQLWFVRGTRVPVHNNEQRVYNTLKTTNDRLRANSPKRGTKSSNNSNENCEFVTIPALPQTLRGNYEKISVLGKGNNKSKPTGHDWRTKPQTRNKQVIAVTNDKAVSRKVNTATRAPEKGAPKNKSNRFQMDINEAHQKFGHLSEGVLRRSMKYHGYELTGELRTCAACALFKARARPLAKVTKLIAHKPGERIYMDTKGPFPATLAGHMYWIKFKDQYSGMSWNAFTRRKHELADALTTRLARFKNKGIMVNFLRCDNAGEHQQYVQTICQQYGVKLEQVAPNTPQHNGVVERQFATEWSRANAMMEAADLTTPMRNRLRAEAIETATMLYNTSCNEADKSPYEKMFDIKPSLNPTNMVQFGRLAYVTDRSKIRRKTDPKAYKCIFVGYALNHSPNTYKLYNPVTSRIILSRDVKWGIWDDVDPKRSINVHRRQVVDQLLRRPVLSAAQKQALNDLLRHYTMPDIDFTAAGMPREDDWEFVDQHLDVLEPRQTRSHGLYGSTGEQTNFPLRTQAPAFYPGAMDADVRPNFTGQDDFVDLEEDFEVINDETLPEDNPEEVETPPEEEEDANEEDINEEEDDDDNEEDDPGDIIVEPKKKKLSREVRGLDTNYNPITQSTRETRRLHTEYNPTIGNNEINWISTHVYSAITSDPGEPTTLKEALSGSETPQWREAIKKEIQNFLTRKVWKKVPREKVVKEMKRKLITTKWIFKKKIEQDGSIRFKARCVSRGFMQIPGVDYTESFAPVATDTAIRMIIGIFLFFFHKYPKEEWALEMFDVKAAFLNADLDKQVFIDWPQGMEELGFITAQDKITHCIELDKAMYGNIDSPLRWMKTFTKFLVEKLQLTQSKSDPCIFIKKQGPRPVLVLALYVDDTLCAGTRKELDWMYKMIMTKFNIEKLGKLKKHLGIWWDWHKDTDGTTYLSATMDKMIEDIGKKYEAATKKKAKAAPTPGYPGQFLSKNTGPMVDIDNYRSIVGKIMYYTTKVAPELSNAARELASHLSNPGREHWKALERCVGYITHQKDPRLVFRTPRELRSISLCDSDYAKDDTDRKSISGRINTIGGMITNWTSKKQSTVALSSTEAEYQSLSECAQEAVFTQSLLWEILGEVTMAIIYEDNLGAIYLTKNQQVSARTKHIDIRHHFLSD